MGRTKVSARTRWTRSGHFTVAFGTFYSEPSGHLGSRRPAGPGHWTSGDRAPHPARQNQVLPPGWVKRQPPVRPAGPDWRLFASLHM